MKVQVHVNPNNIPRFFHEERKILGEALGPAVARFTQAAKEELRRDTRPVFGSRLANTWRSNVYPVANPTKTLDPTGLITSNATEIVSAFDPGGTISPVERKYLAIPTKNVPRTRAGRPMSLGEMQFTYGNIIRPIKGKNGQIVMVMPAIAAKNKRGWRKATKRRIAQGRDIQMVVMFILVRQVRLKQSLNWRRITQRLQTEFPQVVQAAIARALRRQ